ncbi:BamA/TamA family outer membrane protein [Pedobacter sp. MC2016-24]|uniref:translocation and assembly module lipoprotein TamL n=1 Tax=Pedobacter sp. MC2016-24 TaxID=2780090 RepID=UPI00187FBDFB|nr:BamA/TamA family outer membrane protein [Pedobacter sp. MC2016-24]MBE9602413.1 BamA/TamA family outer membrane protein [Pedobacter sp. MC2016-24]
MNRLIRFSLFITACLIWAACSTTKSLKPGQILYTGAEVKINPDSTVKIEDQKAVKEALVDKTRPKPNSAILGVKFGLMIYNLAGEPKKPKGGLRNWLRKKGQAPVLLSEVKLPYNNAVLTSYLISQGYLQSTVVGDTIVKGKKGKAIYTANTGIRYKINQVSSPPDSGALTSIVNQHKENTLLKAGDYYDLDVFKRERERIDADLKEVGYFYFAPDYLILQVDSTVGKNLVDIRIRVKEIAPDAGLKPYTIRDIKIYPNYSLRRDSALRQATPEIYNDFKIYDPQHTFKSPLFNRLIFFKKGELYNRKDHNQSLNRMVNIGSFQAVKAEFIPIDTVKNNQLDLNVYLTPLKKNSLTFSVTGTSKSNNFVGSEVKLTQTTRNLFRGAEQLDVSASGGFESQFGGGTSKGLNSYSFTAEGKLTFPRFITPFKGINSTNAYIPKTVALLSYQLLNRGSLYSLNSFKAQYGYKWNEDKYKEHSFNPISINFVTSNLTRDTVKRDSILNVTPGLRNVLEKQFIIGSTYGFTYTNQFEDYRRNNFYFNGTLETGGNLWGLFAGKNSAGEKSIAGVALNQFVRLEADFRDYFKITKNLTWASRIDLGYGYAYGNQSTLPYVRQFFAGGTNDIRAWAARIIGPGSYYVKNDPKSINSNFLDQSGDIKALVSTELRQKLVSRLYGALFVDAGNVWLRKEDPDRPGSGFKLKNAISEFAVGTGAGLRVDASIFVIRLDVAFPIRKPYNEEGKRWVFDQIDFGSSGWRKENLVYNIGIGYPF